MKSRSVKLFLGKVANSNIRLPRTSYIKKPYNTILKTGVNAGKSVVRHRRAENGIEFYKRDASPKQQQYGIKYRRGTVMTRPMNANDIQALNNSDVAKANPVAHEATSMYASAISEATSSVATEIISKLDVEYQQNNNVSNPASDSDDDNGQQPSDTSMRNPYDDDNN